MRSLLALALTSSLSLAPVALAADDTPFALRGEGYFGAQTLEINNDDNDERLGGGGGTVAANFGALHVQADLAGNSIDTSPEIDTIGGALRFGWRNPERGSFDIVGAVNNTELGSRSANSLRLGGEGRIFAGHTTFGLDAGFFDGDLSSNADGDESAYVDAQIHFYPVESVRLTARGGATGIDDDDPVGMLGFGAEGLLHENVGVLVRYDGLFLDTNDVEIEDHQLVVGVSIYWGGEGQSLRAYDRTYFNASCKNVALGGRRC